MRYWLRPKKQVTETDCVLCQVRVEAEETVDLTLQSSEINCISEIQRIIKYSNRATKMLHTFITLMVRLPTLTPSGRLTPRLHVSCKVICTSSKDGTHGPSF